MKYLLAFLSVMYLFQSEGWATVGKSESEQPLIGHEQLTAMTNNQLVRAFLINWDSSDMSPFENITNFRAVFESGQTSFTSRAAVTEARAETNAKIVTGAVTLGMWDAYVSSINEMPTEPKVLFAGCCFVKNFDGRGDGVDGIVGPNTMFYKNFATHAQVLKGHINSLNELLYQKHMSDTNSNWTELIQSYVGEIKRILIVLENSEERAINQEHRTYLPFAQGCQMAGLMSGFLSGLSAIFGTIYTPIGTKIIGTSTLQWVGVGFFGCTALGCVATGICCCASCILWCIEKRGQQFIELSPPVSQGMVQF